MVDYFQTWATFKLVITIKQVDTFVHILKGLNATVGASCLIRLYKSLGGKKKN